MSKKQEQYIKEVQERLARSVRREAVSWVPACGGTETEFVKNGKKYLYMFNTYTKEHAYYCVSDDLFLSDREASERLGAY